MFLGCFLNILWFNELLWYREMLCLKTNLQKILSGRLLPVVTGGTTKKEGYSCV